MFRIALVTFFATLALSIFVPVATAAATASLVPVIQIGASSPQSNYFAYKVKITNGVPKG